MYYKKHDEIPSLPDDIKFDLINLAEHNLKENVPMLIWFKGTETENKNSLGYINNKADIETLIEKTGGVGFYPIKGELHERVSNFFKNQNLGSPTIYYFLQVVTGGKSVSPHIDPIDRRTSGFLYLLKSGGNNVRTRWYEVKDEFKDLECPEGTIIPYDKLTMVEDNCLEEDTWHWMNFNKIHSVENQETLRVALWAQPI